MGGDLPNHAGSTPISGHAMRCQAPSLPGRPKFIHPITHGEIDTDTCLLCLNAMPSCLVALPQYPAKSGGEAILGHGLPSGTIPLELHALQFTRRSVQSQPEVIARVATTKFYGLVRIRQHAIVNNTFCSWSNQSASQCTPVAGNTRDWHKNLICVLVQG